MNRTVEPEPPSASDGPPCGTEVSPDGRLVVRLAGDLDIASADQAHQRISDAVARYVPTGSPVVILDMTEVAFCDSMGLRTLIIVWKQLRAAGGRLVLAALSPPCRRVLERTGLSQRIEIRPSVESAMRSGGLPGGMGVLG
ncbi:STAS domain-containing protein [Spirillospora sp. CA-294931]|uniref:STAS domain-containing protein n=1 Tax=Spirillospora sp. CA-294931 TaxID=3240042 RepID=UPI003D8BFCBD